MRAADGRTRRPGVRLRSQGDRDDRPAPLPGGGGDEQPGERASSPTAARSWSRRSRVGSTGSRAWAAKIRGPSPSTASRAAAARCRLYGTGSGSSRCRARMPSSHSTFPNPGDPVAVHRASARSAELPALARARRGSNRIVIADRGDGEERVVARFDPGTGALSLDERFRDPGSDRPAFRSERAEWPHGGTAPRGRTDRSSDRVGDERPRHSPRPDGDEAPQPATTGGTTSSRCSASAGRAPAAGACTGDGTRRRTRPARGRGTAPLCAGSSGAGTSRASWPMRTVSRSAGARSPRARSTRDSIARASWRGWTTRPCGRSRACSWRGRGGGAESARP